MEMPFLRSRFTLMGGAKHYTAEFARKSEFNNFKLALDRKGAKYETSHKKRSRLRPEVWTIKLLSPIEALD